MGDRIAFEDWAGIIGIVGFFLTFLGFIYLVVNALRMNQAKRERLAALPLDEARSTEPIKNTPESVNEPSKVD